MSLTPIPTQELHRQSFCGRPKQSRTRSAVPWLVNRSGWLAACTFSVASCIAGFAPDRTMGRQNGSRHHHNMGCRLYLFSADSHALHPSAFWPTAHTHMMLNLYENGQPILPYWRLCQIKLAWSGEGDFAVSLDEKHSPSRHRFTKWSRKWSCG